MDAREFFLEQHDCVRSIIDDMVLGGLSNDQLRYPSQPGLNSLVWLLWHTARWQDFSMRVVEGQDCQLLDQEWLARMNVSRRDVGTGMTPEECAAFNSHVNVAAVRDYWTAMRERVKQVASDLPADEWSQTADEVQLRQAFADGAIGSERARWLESFMAGKTRAWWLSFCVWHMTEHLLGGAICVRRLKGIPLGL